METKATSNKTLWATLLVAAAASLCCITPVLGILAGIGGIASAFSWLEPFRPYLIALTLGILAFAWYKKLRPVKSGELDCACETDEKPAFWHSKAFLALISVAAVLLLTFPWYSGLFFQTAHAAPIIVEKENIAMATLSIQGMTCSGCEQSVNKALRDTTGVIESSSDHQRGLAWVKYDKSRTGFDDFRNAVEKIVGYKVTDIQAGMK
jgi:copper chaperone CopZ